MLRDMDSRVCSLQCLKPLLCLHPLVTEDLVRYMDYAMSGNNKFLIDDPNWSIDFAPNGKSCAQTPRAVTNFLGTLLGFNETLTRKRYAE